jgi:hypothetical protein
MARVAVNRSVVTAGQLSTDITIPPHGGNTGSNSRQSLKEAQTSGRKGLQVLPRSPLHTSGRQFSLSIPTAMRQSTSEQYEGAPARPGARHSIAQIRPADRHGAKQPSHAGAGAIGIL